MEDGIKAISCKYEAEEDLLIIIRYEKEWYSVCVGNIAEDVSGCENGVALRYSFSVTSGCYHERTNYW